MRIKPILPLLPAALLAVVPAFAELPQAAVRPPTTQPMPHGMVYRDLCYGDPAAGRGNLLDLYLPADQSKPVPLVIWIHGGGWVAGDKAFCPLADAALRRGYAVASINYRYSSDAPFPAMLFDCKGAVRFLRASAAQYGVDPDRIGVWGESAGGHLAALLGTTNGMASLEGTVGGNAGVSSAVRAVVDYFGPADMLTYEAQLDPKTFPEHMRREPTLMTKLLGGRIAERHAVAEAASPKHHVSGDDVPFLIVHGDADPIVPVAQSRELDAALRAAGVPSKLIVVPGAKHGGIGFFSARIIEQVSAFFDTHLREAR